MRQVSQSVHEMPDSSFAPNPPGAVSSGEILRIARAITRITARTDDAQALASNVCRTIARNHVFQGAWVALLDEDREPAIVAQAGLGRSFRSWFFTEGFDAYVKSLLAQRERHTLRIIKRAHGQQPSLSCGFGRSALDCRSLMMTLDHAGEAIGVIALCMAPAITFTEEQKILFQGMRAELGMAFYGLRERALAEARRKESEDLYRTIFEHSGTLLWLVEPDGTISLANRLSELLTGYSRSETENLKRWEDFFSDKDVLRMRRYRRARLYSGKPAARQFQARLIAKSGKTRTVLVSPAVVPGTKRMIPSMIDISARKKAEQDVRRLNEYLQAIVDNANVLVVLLDGRGRVRVWNRAAELITGYSASEVVGRGRPWTRLSPYSITEQAGRALVDRITAGEAIDDVEASIVSARGESRLISWYAKGIVDRNEKLLGIVVLGRDVTKHREMEEQRMEAEARAQHAQRLAAIGEMAAGVAHEINNPLTGIIGLAQLLAREDLDPLATEQVQAIVEGGQRIARIVDSLLSFAGRRQFTSELVPLNECVVRAINSQRDRLQQADIHLYSQLDPSDPIVGGDASCLERVFQNLLVNAHDALCEVDSERRLLVRTQRAGDLVRVEIQDNGKGIPHSALARVFQPFYTTKPPGKGTGLGLSICHGLVAEHGGRIFARNNAGAGVTLVVELPTTANDGEPAPRS